VLQELLVNFPLDRCDKHDERSLQLYCNTCRKTVCVACSVDATHRAHDKDEVRIRLVVAMKKLTVNLSRLKRSIIVSVVSLDYKLSDLNFVCYSPSKCLQMHRDIDSK